MASAGLVNLGNKCYLSSVLQCLLVTQQRRRRIPITKLGKRICEQMDLMRGSKRAVDSSGLIDALGISDDLPEDANQYYLLIMDLLFESDDRHLVSDYYSTLTDAVACQNCCKYYNEKTSVFNQLTVYPSPSIAESITKLFRPEMVECSCTRCPSLKCVRKYTAKRLPVHLVVHVTARPTRCQHRLQFARSRYDLVAFVGFESGHYVAATCVAGKRYYLYDDSRVCELTREMFIKLLDRTCYLLFYTCTGAENASFIC